MTRLGVGVGVDGRRQDEHKSALELVKKMLSPEADRYDAEEALKSPYMLQMTSENCCVIC